MRGVYLNRPLRVLSCAVAGRPGRSAYETAADAGYTGSAEDFAALLAALPEALRRLEELESTLALLSARVSVLEKNQGAHP